MVTVSKVLERAEASGRVGTLPWSINPGFRDVAEAQTVEEAIVAAKLDYDVDKVPVHLPESYIVGKNTFTSDRKEIPDTFALVRRDTQDTFGIVGRVYQPVTNVQKFAWFNNYLQTGLVKLTHAGQLEGGKKVALVARFNTDDFEVQPGDAIARYLLLSDTFDGKSALSVSLMTVRLVCANGAVAYDKQAHHRFRHSRHTVPNMDLVRADIDRANANFEHLFANYKLLTEKPMPNEKHLRDYIKDVFEFTETQKVVGGQIVTMPSTRSAHIVDGIVNRVNSRINTINNNTTYWSAYNGITEYLNHEYGRNHGTRLDNLWFGKSAALTNRALEVALQMAA
jgi:phage/plasmid-like protein (TIGR03299 family)